MSDNPKSTNSNSQPTNRLTMGDRQELLSEMQFALNASLRNLENAAQKMDQYANNPATAKETNRLDVMGTEHSLYSAMSTLDSCMHGVDVEKSRLFEVQKNRGLMSRDEGPGKDFNGVSEQSKKTELDGISQRLNEKAEQTPQQADRSLTNQELER